MADTERAALTPEEVLELADWRRRVQDLYASVRRMIRSDPVAAHALWRSERERLYREHSQSPVPPAGRDAFRALHFAHHPALSFEVPIEPDPTAWSREAPAGDGAVSALPVSTGGEMVFHRIGWADVPFPSGRRRLSVYWLEGYAGGLFLPFRDKTNGDETYGGGRYLLDSAKSADLGGDPVRGTLILDFNFAYHPSCAFDPRWTCPLSPPENRLDIPIRAGERLA